MPTSKKINVAILGASGFIGIELLQRLVDHPHVNLVFMGSENYIGEYPSTLFPPLRRHDFFKKNKFSGIDDLCDSDVVISALPVGVLPDLLTKISPKTKKIINVSGDFRLTDPKEIKEYYPESLLVQNTIDSKYIIPDFSNDFSANILNMPGCIASAAIYALCPLAENGLLGEEVIIDAKVGSSGGGKKQSDSHSVRANNAKTYKILHHRHSPEIKQYLNSFTMDLKRVFLTVTSIDITRGILIHVHGNTKRKVTDTEFYSLFRNYYKNHPFHYITCFKKGNEKLPSIKTVQGTNDCEIGFATDETSNHFVVTAAIDNLVKGGAGNAIHALNKLYGFDINLGLRSNVLWP